MLPRNVLANKTRIAHNHDLQGFSTENTICLWNAYKIKSKTSLYNTFAASTFCLLNWDRLGNPNGNRSSLSGIGRGAPCRRRWSGSSFSLALEDVPHATPACMAVGCRVSNKCQSSCCPSLLPKSTSIAENLDVCLLCFQSMHITSKPLWCMCLLRLPVPAKISTNEGRGVKLDLGIC